MSATVVALLVSHDGARWLPAVIEGVREQLVPVDGVVCVDTTSRDDSPRLLTEAFGEVLTAPGSTSYPEAVRLGLEHVPDDVDWVWLLHDDANPAPEALAALLAAADEHPEADVLGPKLREWPSLRRLLELGVTISGTGRRETGLERGEYDQGQHDEVRRVLAVNTAGMLVRRDVLQQLGGFSEHLPIFGNDIDFGWRAAAAGHTTLIVPQAVVFHAEAAHRGTRRTPLTGRHIHYQERRAALFTLLANAPAHRLPWQVVRLALGTVLRMVGLMLVRQVGQALDELAALLSLYGNPRLLLAARRARRRRETRGTHDVRELLAPWWLPYRHGLDFVSDLAGAATNQAADVAERRRVAAGKIEPRLEDDEEEWTRDSGLLVRFFTNPVALLVSLFVVLALVGAREGFGSVSGGALSPVPETARHWWQLHVESWHPLGQGTDVPAPPYVLPLALLGTLLGTTGAVSALLVLAVPLTFWGGWRFLRVVGSLVGTRNPPTWLLFWGAATFALSPATSGAWGLGRFGIVAVATGLPWLAHACLGFADPDADRRWRAGWRAGLLLALTAAFAPLAWWFSLVLAGLVVGAAFVIAPRLMKDRDSWGPPAAALLTVPVLLSPWWVSALLSGAWEGLFLDAGRIPMEPIGFRELLTGHLGDAGAPWWLGLLLVAAAVLALLPSRSRIPVFVCWIVALAAAVVAAVLGFLRFHLAAVDTGAGLGFLVLVLQAAFLVAAFLGALGLVLNPPRRSWLRLAGFLPAAVAVLVPVVGLGWFVVKGPGELSGNPDTGIPAYMTQEALTGPAHGILVLSGDVDQGLRYRVVRGEGPRLGEDEVLALSEPDAALAADLHRLVAGPSRDAVDALAGDGIEYIVLPAPADGRVAAVLDASGGLTQASAENRETRAWQVAAPVDPHAVDGPDSWVHLALVALQAVAILVVAVLAVPSRIGEAGDGRRAERGREEAR